MQVTETRNEGLKRELKVVVGADELENQLVDRLNELKGQVRLRGFRPGKVPVAHLRKVYGRSVMAEVVQKAVDETSQQALTEREEQPAYQPEISLTEDEKEIEQVMEGKADLAFTMAFEVVPPFDIADLSGLKLEKPVAEVGDDQIADALQRIAQQYRDFAPRDAKEKAKDGDRVTIDFVGRIDGEAFEGGSAEDVPLELGSNSFIPGFEEQLVGAKAGDEREVKVTFPADYGAEHLAGKDAVFAVTVKEVAAPQEGEPDDEFAKKLGMDSLDALKERIREQIASEHEGASKAKMKRQLLDRLDEMHTFDLPEKLVDGEFEQIWHALTHEMEHEGKSFEDEGTTEEEARKEYRAIAERRVRLGLVLGRIGEEAGVTIGDEELQGALIERARQFPGQERQVFDYYRNNPQAMMELRGPLFEQKAVDTIIEKADVTETPVSREELFADPDEEAEAEKPKAKKAAAKKPAAKKASKAKADDGGKDEGEAKAKPAAKAESKTAAKTAKKPAAKKTAAKGKADTASKD